MANEPVITLVGNCAHDPELRFLSSGVPVCTVTVMQTPRSKKDDQWIDGEPIAVRVQVWRDMAENVANTLRSGSRVVVMGRLKTRSFEDREGNKRSSLELEADAIGPDLRYATASVTKIPRGSGSGSGGFGGGQSSGGGFGSPGTAPQDDPWGSPAPAGGGFGGSDDPPPF